MKDQWQHKRDERGKKQQQLFELAVLNMPTFADKYVHAWDCFNNAERNITERYLYNFTFYSIVQLWQISGIRCGIHLISDNCRTRNLLYRAGDENVKLRYMITVKVLLQHFSNICGDEWRSTVLLPYNIINETSLL